MMATNLSVIESERHKTIVKLAEYQTKILANYKITEITELGID